MHRKATFLKKDCAMHLSRRTQFSFDWLWGQLKFSQNSHFSEKVINLQRLQLSSKDEKSKFRNAKKENALCIRPWRRDFPLIDCETLFAGRSCTLANKQTKATAENTHVFIWRFKVSCICTINQMKIVLDDYTTQSLFGPKIVVFLGFKIIFKRYFWLKNKFVWFCCHLSRSSTKFSKLYFKLGFLQKI